MHPLSNKPTSFNSAAGTFFGPSPSPYLSLSLSMLGLRTKRKRPCLSQALIVDDLDPSGMPQATELQGQAAEDVRQRPTKSRAGGEEREEEEEAARLTNERLPFSYVEMSRAVVGGKGVKLSLQICVVCAGA